MTVETRPILYKLPQTDLPMVGFVAYLTGLQPTSFNALYYELELFFLT
jgi:hypothetical protein